eukprot:1531970-Pleurochrysis_carterae.AAC.1
MGHRLNSRRHRGAVAEEAGARKLESNVESASHENPCNSRRVCPGRCVGTCPHALAESERL